MPTPTILSRPLTRQSNFFKVSLAMVAMVMAGVLFLLTCFPFRRQAMVQRVETRTQAKVEMGRFRETWFPPGCSATQVRLTARDGGVLTVDSIEVEGTYTGFLRKPTTLKWIHARGLHLTTSLNSHGGLLDIRTDQPKAISVGEIRIDDTVVSILSDKPGRPPLEFAVHSLVLTNAAPDRSVGFQVSLHTPRLPGEVRSQGEFGPLDAGRLWQTPVSGAFTFQHADLKLDHGISGMLDASGTYSGEIRHLLCKGTADVPRFQVFGGSHSVHVAARFEASVDALNGNAELNKIVARFKNTTVEASGTVADEPERPGKRLTLDATVRNGRVEDILPLFTERSASPMNAALNASAKLTVPAGPPGFLTKLRMDGQFAITDGHFTSEKAQVPIDRLSASAAGKSKHLETKPASLVPVEIRGSVDDRNGVAALRGIVFSAPGLHCNLAGKFGLRDQRIDLHGTIQTAGRLADTTAGVKALVLKAVAPLWPTKALIKTIPFSVSGKASDPVFRLKLQR